MLTSAITTIAATYLFVSLFALAPRKAGYSHVMHSISEIGEIGAPDQRFVSFGLFMPIGLVLLFLAAALRSASVPLSALALCIAVGYIAAAIFPCDPGSPLLGTTRQALHNLAGAVQYAGGGFALMALAPQLGQPFKIAGIAVLGSAILLSISSLKWVRGIIQRVAEICLFGGLACAAWQFNAAV